jgi:HEAT repeat protein
MAALPAIDFSELLLATVTMLAVIAAAFAIVGGHRRRLRQDARRHARVLERQFAEFLAGRTKAESLRAATERADSGAFWTAVETFALGLESKDWERLSSTLGDGGHAAAERTTLDDDSPWRRELAARRLGLVYSPASRRALRRALVRGPEAVRYTSALSLGRYRDIAALRWLLKHPRALARRTPRAHIGVLSSFGAAAIDELKASLERGSSDPRMERAIIEMLGLAGYRAASTVIDERLRAPDLELRIAAARALGRMRAIESTTALIGALKDADWQVRAQSARALGRMRAPLAVYALAGCLTDRSWWVRHHAAYALGELGDDGRTALRAAATGSEDPYARDMAREVLDGGFPRSA